MPPLNVVSRSALAIAIAQALAANPVQAATITVDSVTDDGVACTFRDAFTTIKEGSDQSNDCIATGSFGANDTIDFDSSLSNQTISLTQGAIDFGAYSNIDLTINGLGRNRLTISGNSNSRVFYVRDSVLNINDVTISQASSAVDGGAIRSRSSTLNLNNTNVSGNTANAKGAGIFASGGTVTLSNSRVTGNSAADGGGIYIRNNDLLITDSTLSDNSASNEGGGIRATGVGDISMTNSTVSDNSANRGGGIRAVTSNIDLTNSTISNNLAAFSGAGIYASSNTVHLTNSTIAANSGLIRSGLNATSNTVTLRNSIIAGNRSELASGAEIGSINSTIIATDNLLGDSANTNGAAFAYFTPDSSNVIATSDGLNASALSTLIGPLSDNRGITQTHALKPNSLGIDSGDNGNCPTNDQRGEARSDGACDIGAVEYLENMDAAVIQVDSASDDGMGCTLRDAVETFNSGFSGNGCVIDGGTGVYDLINFAPSLNNSTITLTQTSPLYFTKAGLYGVINGLGQDSLEINGGNNGRVFYFLNTIGAIRNVTIAGGNPSFLGGGAIRTRLSNLTLSNSTLSGNSASTGAGLESADGKITLINSTISDNTATGGGGGLRMVSSDVLVANSTLANNSASTGGGIATTLDNTINLTNSTLSGNYAQVFGGGISFDAGVIKVSNSTVTGNTAGSSSGGIYTKSSTSVTILNSLFTGNRAPNNAEVRFNGASVSATFNLFGDSENSNVQAFGSFNPIYAGSFSATNDSFAPRALGGIIGPLSDNRGPTQTHALRLNSPAVNSGSNTNCLSVDQRGEAREDGQCDIGAIELNDTLDLGTVVVDSAFDDAVGCTLREAVESFNSTMPLANDCVINGTSGIRDVIEFSPSLNDSTITLTQPLEMRVDQPGLDLTINGLGQNNLEINGYNNSRVLYVQDSTVEVNNLTIADGSAPFNGGGLEAIRSEVTLNNTTLSNNSGEFGGGLSATSSSVNLYNSLLLNNTANISGGGISGSLSDIKIFNSTLSENSAAERGGAAFTSISGNINIYDSTLSTNSAYTGGAIANLFPSSISLTNSQLNGNSANYGGGVFSLSGTVNLNSSSLSQNEASVKGGAIAVINSLGLISLTNNTLSNNSAVEGGGAIYARYSVATLGNNTLYGNSANIGGAIYTNDTSGIQLSNNLITGNLAATGATVANTVDGSVTGSHNLFSDASKLNANAFSNFTPGPNDIVATNDGTKPNVLSQILSPLADNGGNTFTHALVAKSPARNAAPSAGCPSFDQIGQRRNDAACDIGAFEFIPENSFFVVPLPNGKSVIFSL